MQTTLERPAQTAFQTSAIEVDAMLDPVIPVLEDLEEKLRSVLELRDVAVERGLIDKFTVTLAELGFTDEQIAVLNAFVEGASETFSLY